MHATDALSISSATSAHSPMWAIAIAVVVMIVALYVAFAPPLHRSSAPGARPADGPARPGAGSDAEPR